MTFFRLPFPCAAESSPNSGQVANFIIHAVVVAVDVEFFRNFISVNPLLQPFQIPDSANLKTAPSTIFHAGNLLLAFLPLRRRLGRTGVVTHHMLIIPNIVYLKMSLQRASKRWRRLGEENFLPAISARKAAFFIPRLLLQ